MTALAGNRFRRGQAAKALSDIRAQNVALAEASMATQRAIEEAKTHVAIVRGGEYAAMRNQFDELYGRQQALVDKVGPEIIMRRFKEELQQVRGCRGDAVFSACSSIMLYSCLVTGAHGQFAPRRQCCGCWKGGTDHCRCLHLSGALSGILPPSALNLPPLFH